MKVVYDAANVIDAHLVRHALEAEDIPVFLKGEALVGGMGELPLFGVVQVCVPGAAWPKARSVVESLGLGEGARPVGESGGVGDGVPSRERPRATLPCHPDSLFLSSRAQRGICFEESRG